MMFIFCAIPVMNMASPISRQTSDSRLPGDSIRLNAPIDSVECTKRQAFCVVLCPDSLVVAGPVFNGTVTSYDASFCIINTCLDTLKLLMIDAAPPLTIDYIQGDSILPMAKSNVTLKFIPEKPGAVCGQITVKLKNLSTGKDSSAFLPYCGIGLAPQIAIGRDTINFGDVAVGGPGKEKKLYVSNVGNDTLRITDIDSSIIGDKVFILQYPKLPWLLEPKRTQSMSIQFKPDTEGIHRHSFDLISNSFTDKRLTINLLGNGFTGPGIEFEFDSIAFDTCLGTTQTDSVKLRNIGNKILKVWRIDSPNFMLLPPSIIDTLKINPGRDTTLTFGFAPKIVVDTIYKVVARSNRKGGDSTLTVKVKSDIASFRVAPTQALLDTIVAVVGDSEFAAFFIDNASNCPVFVDTIYVVPDTLPFDVSVRKDTVDAYGQTTVWVSYTPKDTLPHTAQVVIRADYFTSPESLTVHGKGRIGAHFAFDSNPMDFDKKCIGKPSSREMRVQNFGYKEFVIDTITATGSQYFAIWPMPSREKPIKIGIKGEQVFSVTYKPSDIGAHHATFTFSAPSATGEKTLAVQGEGIEVELAASPLDMPFYEVGVFDSSEKILKLTNRIERPIDITNIELVPPDAPFMISPTTGKLLGQDSFFLVNVQYKPQKPGADSAQIIICHNANCADDTISLSGTGCAPQLQIPITEVVFDTISYCQKETLDTTIDITGCQTWRLQDTILLSDVFKICSIDTVVSPGNKLHISLCFDPNEENSYVDTFVIRSNLFPDSVWTITVRGVAKDRTAPQIVNSTQCSPKLSGSDNVVSAAATDNCDPVPACTLYYRPAGASSLAEVMVLFDEDGKAMISGSVMTVLGVEYRIKASDVSGNVAWDPPVGYHFIPGRVASPDGLVWLNSQVEQSRYLPTARDTTSYRLISVPLILDESTADKVIEDDLPEYDGGVTWLLYDYYNGNYHEYKDPTGRSHFRAFQPNRAFWLITTKLDKVMDSGPGISVATSPQSAAKCNLADYSRYRLESGWNLVANPYLFKIDRNQCKLSSGNDLYQIWRFEVPFNESVARWQHQPPLLEPWKGYAIYALQIDTLIFANTESTSSTEVANRAIKPVMTNMRNWHVSIEARAGIHVDFDNYAGVREQSQEKWDQWDLFEPPPIGEYVSVYFPHDDWPNYPSDYAGDFRQPFTDGAIWTFEVRSNLVDVPVYVNITDMEKVPKNFAALLIDDTHDQVLDLSYSTQYTFKVLGENVATRFHLVIGSQEFISQVHAEHAAQVRTYGLRQSFPNPFNRATIISYALSEVTRVKLDIYNLLGERVQILVNDEWFTQGIHYVYWDGKNSAGKEIASGAYFVRLQAGKVKQIRKMLYVK